MVKGFKRDDLCIEGQTELHWSMVLKHFKTNLLFLACNNKRNFELLKTPLVLKALEETQLCYFEPEILSSRFFPKETIVPVPQFPDKGCVFSGTSLLCPVGGWGVLRGLVVWHVPFLFSFLPWMSLFSEILPVSIPGLDLSQGLLLCISMAPTPLDQISPSWRAGAMSCLLFMAHQAQHWPSININWISDPTKDRILVRLKGHWGLTGIWKSSFGQTKTQGMNRNKWVEEERDRKEERRQQDGVPVEGTVFRTQGKQRHNPNPFG